MEPKLAGQHFPNHKASCEQLTKPDTYSTYFHMRNYSSQPLTCRLRRVLTNCSEKGAKSMVTHWASRQWVARVQAFCKAADHSPGPVRRTQQAATKKSLRLNRSWFNRMNRALGNGSCQDVCCTCSVRQSVHYFPLLSESTTEENTALYRVGHVLKEQLVQIQVV